MCVMEHIPFFKKIIIFILHAIYHSHYYFCAFSSVVPLIFKSGPYILFSAMQILPILQDLETWVSLQSLSQLCLIVDLTLHSNPFITLYAYVLFLYMRSCVESHSFLNSGRGFAGRHKLTATIHYQEILRLLFHSFYFSFPLVLHQMIICIYPL